MSTTTLRKPWALVADFDKTMDTPDARKVVPLETKAAMTRWVVELGNEVDILTGMMIGGVDGTAGEPILDIHDQVRVVFAEEGGIWWFPQENRYELHAPELASEVRPTMKVWEALPADDGSQRQVWIGKTAVSGFAKDEAEFTRILESCGYTVIARDHQLAIDPNDDDVTIAKKRAAIEQLHRKNLLERGFTIEGRESRMLQITYNANWLEYLPIGVNKTATLGKAREVFGWDGVIAAGDGANDSFIDVADISWAVNNAVTDLKLRASRVSEEVGGHGVAEALNRAIQPNSARFASRAFKEVSLDKFWQQESGIALKQNEQYARLVDAFFLLNPSILGQVVSDGKTRDRMASSRFPYRVTRINGDSSLVVYVAADRRQAQRWAQLHLNDAVGRLDVQRNMLQGRWLVSDTLHKLSGVWRLRDRVVEREEMHGKTRTRSATPSPNRRLRLDPNTVDDSLYDAIARIAQRSVQKKVAIMLDGSARISPWLRKYIADELAGVPDDFVPAATIVAGNGSEGSKSLPEMLQRFLARDRMDGPPNPDTMTCRGFPKGDGHEDWVNRYTHWVFITDGALTDWPAKMPERTTIVVLSKNPTFTSRGLRGVHIENAEFVFVRADENQLRGTWRPDFGSLV